MNWLDLLLIALLGYSAVRGFMRGFIVEVCGLIGLVLGIWGAVHGSRRVGEWLHLDPSQEWLSFIITVLAVLAIVHLLARMVTKAMDLASLSLPNKVAGSLFALLRQAFTLSVLLNVLVVKQLGGWPPDQATQAGSMLYTPLRAFAPAIVPALGNSKWMRSTIDDITHAFPVEGDPDGTDPEE